jgi:sugar lactone lactonase YvrE
VNGDHIAFSGQVLSAPACLLGEGPTYDPHTGTAWWFDILGKQLFEVVIETGAVKQHALPEMGSVLARVDATRQVIATETGLHLRNARTGALELMTPIENDNPATRSNDGGFTLAARCGSEPWANKPSQAPARFITWRAGG